MKKLAAVRWPLGKSGIVIHLNHHLLIPEECSGQWQAGGRRELEAVAIVGWAKHCQEKGPLVTDHSPD
jgi:hypothetical protein